VPSALEESLLSLKKAGPGPRRAPCCSRASRTQSSIDNSGCSWDSPGKRPSTPESGRRSAGGQLTASRQINKVDLSWLPTIGELSQNVPIHHAMSATDAVPLLMKSQKLRGGHIINSGSVSADASRLDSALYRRQARDHPSYRVPFADSRKSDIDCAQIDVGNAATEMSERMATGVLQANGHNHG
jgi:hypothetical protein